MNDAKPWYESKTIWLNIAAAALVAVQALTGALQPLLPVDVYQAIAAGLPLANGMLRLLTSVPIIFDATDGH